MIIAEQNQNTAVEGVNVTKISNSRGDYLQLITTSRASHSRLFYTSENLKEQDL